MKRLILVVSLVLALFFTFACQNRAEKAELEKFRAQANVEEQNAALYRKMVEEWNKGNLEYMKAMLAPEYAFYMPSGNPKPLSGEETIAMNKGNREGFPDLTWTIVELVTVGDRVITRGIFRGTHTGPYQGMAPTGNKVELSSIIMSRMSNGKLVEEREEFDILNLMQQLGFEVKQKEVKK